MLEIIVWNAVVVLVMATTIKLLSRVPWLQQRPALIHLLWLAVLIQLVIPSFVPIKVFPSKGPLSWVAMSSDPEAALLYGAAGDSDAESSQSGGHLENRAVLDHSIPQHRFQEARTSQSDESRQGRQSSRTVSRDSSADRSMLSRIGIVLVGLWVVGAIVFLSGMIRQERRARRVLLLAQRDPMLNRVMRDVLARFGCAQELPIRATLADLSPSLLGCSAPCVIMPRAALEQLSTEELRLVVAHEVAHFVRRDHWSIGFANLVCAIMWWHPVAWWSRSELRVLQEYCADAMASSFDSRGGRYYAETLWKIVNQLSITRTCPAPASVGLGNHFSSRNMRRRFEMLAKRERIMAHTKLGGLLVACGVVMAFCLPVQATVVQENQLGTSHAKTQPTPNEWTARRGQPENPNQERSTANAARQSSARQQEDQDDYEQDQYSHDIKLTVRRDNGAYGTAAFSFRFATQDFREHQNQVDLVYNRCGLLHVNAHARMQSRVVDLGEVNYFAHHEVPDENWLSACVQPVKDHVYIQEINDGMTKAYVKFTVVDIKDDGELTLKWSPLDPMQDWPRFRQGRAGTMGQCGGAHRIR